MNLGNKILSLLLYLYILLLPLLPSKFKIKNIPFNGDILLACIILVYLFTIIIFRDSRKRFMKGLKDFFTNYLSIFITILALIMFISVSYAGDKKIALGESIRFLTYIVLYFIIKYELNKKAITDNILKLYLGVTTIINLVGIVECINGIGFVDKSEHGVRIRIFSTLENSNNLGVFMVIAIFPLIMLALNEKKRKKKLFFSLLAFLALINLILSLSRNAWAGFAIGCLVLAFIYSWKILIGFLGLGGISLFIPQISNRLIEFTDKSQNLSRVKLWDIAFMMIKDHPIKGVGNGNYRVFYEKYKLKYKNKIEYYPTDNFHTHNIFLKIQSELGIFGTIAFIAMIVSIISRVIIFLRTTKDKVYKTFYKGFLASLIAFICMNFIDNFFSAPKVIAFFWLLIAVFEGVMYREAKEGDLY
ncbi:O-antigen ligase family protein [Clostridium tetanomorphum]|uniref:O-antigen ligase family protein n=2 Tax=Clostridium tetanomorphum TaxID=1553 RepID=A0A923EAM1_CLOTT|nr:O-antigen ligase family protein [Clostridium tetanomorphum]MBC2399553.1 O-antigen ligase family protein [Clostridium tetanomorphum]NRZ96193.1 O-antigen ligase [Clostridium tetanomorphum]